MILGAFQLLNPNGTVGVSWRHPQNTSLGYLTLDYWTSLARTLEAADFDFGLTLILDGLERLLV